MNVGVTATATAAAIGSVLLSPCAVATSPSDKPQVDRPDPPVAFNISEHVVYGYGQPIDLTFSIAVPDVEDGRVLPNFEILNEVGEAVEPREVDGCYFWEAPGKAIDGAERQGTISAGHQHTETIADLREWYELDAPGTYRFTFDGEWRLPATAPGRRGEVESHPVGSNTLVIRIARPLSEDEPHGEPIEGRVIPLEEIWALDMPGTKPMQTAMSGWDEMKDVAPEGTMVREIRQAINKSEWPPRNAPPGFAVRGTGMDALREAHAVLVGGQPPQKQFRQGEQISLVFFSKYYGRYVHLDRVEQHDSIVQISYKLIAHETTKDTSHLALIPFTVPAVEDVRIELRPLIDWTERIISPPSLEHLAHRVCHPFTFTVRP